MNSAAESVTAYLEQVPEERRECLRTLRKLCREILVGYEEGMEHGMPTYKKAGVLEVAFASQKNYISLYVLKQEVVNTHRAALTGASIGKGCIRFTRSDKMDFAVLRQLLTDTAAAPEAAC